jgi:hypothetical protein
MDELPTHVIVSQILTTAGGAQVWVEQNGHGVLAVRCLGCKTWRPKVAMAPALLALVTHAPECTVRR